MRKLNVYRRFTRRRVRGTLVQLNHRNDWAAFLVVISTAVFVAKECAKLDVGAMPEWMRVFCIACATLYSIIPTFLLSDFLIIKATSLILKYCFGHKVRIIKKVKEKKRHWFIPEKEFSLEMK